MAILFVGRLMPAKRDGNHQSMRDILLPLGALDMSGVPGAGCDFIVPRAKTRTPVFIEVKSCKTETRTERLTKAEQKLQAAFPRDYFVVMTVEEALAAVGISAS